MTRFSEMAGLLAGLALFLCALIAAEIMIFSDDEPVRKAHFDSEN